MKEIFDLYSIKIDNERLIKFEKYKELLLYYNSQFNLTAITDEREIIIKHFVDSVSLIRALDLKDKEINEKNIEDAKKALKKGKELVEKYDLNMMILDASYTFDRNQLIFNFLWSVVFFNFKWFFFAFIWLLILELLAWLLFNHASKKVTVQGG